MIKNFFITILFMNFALILSACALAQQQQGLYLKYEITIVDREATSETEQFSIDSLTKELNELFGKVPSILFHGIGRGGADKVFVEVNVVEVKGNVCLINYTITLFNASILCEGEHCEILKRLARKEISMEERGGKKVLDASRFYITKLLLVNLTNNDVTDYETGRKLGEWIFWLNPKDLQLNETLIMGGILHSGVFILDYQNFSMSILLYINFNLTGSVDYQIGRAKVGKERTAIGLAHPGILRIRFYGATARDVDYLAERWRVFGCKAVDFGNRTTDIDCGSIKRIFTNLSHKPWRLVELAYTGKFSSTFILVEYAGSEHVAVPFVPLRLVYDKRTGLLLSASCIGRTCLPPAHLSNYLSDRYINVSLTFLPHRTEMRLIETNAVLELPELGGPGRADEHLHWAVSVAVAVAALALAFLPPRRTSGRRA
jgi:hypothetical protein